MEFTWNNFIKLVNLFREEMTIDEYTRAIKLGIDSKTLGELIDIVQSDSFDDVDDDVAFAKNLVSAPVYFSASLTSSPRI